ncbi:MFS transporter [Longimycelium tulufanense]|uniref:MFS transporter n=1 Tax=Longimycelium tulufanense TaxID=907463 RepID=A0A8J3FTL4_9PSEU|nr:MFS transporter [Longimycelium tulufanense]GGM41343.1 MFS transporter [Longimycelium tulufanense]
MRQTADNGTLLVVLTGAFMGILDFFIVNVTIPSIEGDLGATTGQIQLVVAGYALAYALGLVTGGRLGDLQGHRRVFVIGLTAFTVTSLACGLATSAWLLVAFRVLQGASAALLTPQVLSILNINFTGPARARAFAAYGATLGLAAACGQLIGGLLVAWNPWGWGWRTCFLINLPIGLAALVAVRFLVPKSRSSLVRRLDLPGVALATLSLGALIVPLVLGRETHWPTWAWMCLALSLPALTVFVRYEQGLARRGGSPLIETSLFTDRNFVTGLVIVLAFYASLASFFLVLSVFLQNGAHLTALAAGTAFTPLGVGFVATSSLSARIGAALGRQALTLGAAIMAVSYAVLWSATTDPNQLNWLLLGTGLFLNGLGEGVVMTLLISTVLTGVRPDHAGSGSGILTTTQQFSSALGVALIGLIFYGVLGPSNYPADHANAFHASLLYTTGLLLLVTLLVQLLPTRRSAHHMTSTPEKAST